MQIIQNSYFDTRFNCFLGLYNFAWKVRAEERKQNKMCTMCEDDKKKKLHCHSDDTIVFSFLSSMPQQSSNLDHHTSIILKRTSSWVFKKPHQVCTKLKKVFLKCKQTEKQRDTDEREAYRSNREAGGWH